MPNQIITLLLIILIGCSISLECGKAETRSMDIDKIAVNSITPLEKLTEVSKNMDMSTWPTGHPVSIADLAYVKLRYWGFDDNEHVGALIINKDLAQDILEIFIELYKSKFPIEQMRLIYEFNNNDDESMAANNSSAFNCREVTGQPDVFSQHSYGRAIDINPKINPYVKNNIVLPENGHEHVDRDKPEKGKITRDSFIYTLFIERGWDWGGDWKDLQDFQHFEKRANGEKRNPNGNRS